MLGKVPRAGAVVVPPCTKPTAGAERRREHAGKHVAEASCSIRHHLCSAEGFIGSAQSVPALT